MNLEHYPAEAFVIGLATIEPALWPRMAASLAPEHFSDLGRLFWQTMGQLHAEGCDASLPQVVRRLELIGELTPDRLEILLRCGSLCPVWRIHEADQACELLLREVLAGLARERVPGSQLEEKLGKIRELQAKIANLRGEHDGQSVPQITDQLLDTLNGTAHRDPRIISWGLIGLDKLTDGLAPGKLVVVGARPGEGKSAMGIQVARQAIDKHQAVLFISLEMGATQCHGRLLCAASGINTEDRYRSDYERGELAETARQYRAAPIQYRTVTGIDGICALARQVASITPGFALLVVDYIQKVEQSASLRKGAARYEIIGDITRKLKTLAMDLDIPVLALAQVGRNIQGKPGLAGLRESGDIEADADIVVLIHFGKDGMKEKEEAPCAQLLVPKNREGSIGTAKAQFRRVCARWENPAREWEERTDGWDDGLKGD